MKKYTIKLTPEEKKFLIDIIDSDLLHFGKFNPNAMPVRRSLYKKLTGKQHNIYLDH